MAKLKTLAPYLKEKRKAFFIGGVASLVGAGAGALAGGIQGLINKGKMNDMEEEMEADQKALEWSNNLANSSAIQASYNTEGTGLTAMQKGGTLRRDTAGIDSVLNANQNIDWVQRLYEKNGKSVQIPGQKGTSTHFMESGDGKVYPTVVNKKGKMTYLGDKARDYADSTNTGIQFSNDEDAQWFGENYKKGTGVLKDYKDGGIHIKPENKGKFNATKKATGKTTEELTHSSNPVTKKRAIFAQNAAKWHHEYGGLQPLHYQMGGSYTDMNAVSGQHMQAASTPTKKKKFVGGSSYVPSFDNGGYLVSAPGGYGIDKLQYKPTKYSFLSEAGNFQKGGVKKDDAKKDKYGYLIQDPKETYTNYQNLYGPLVDRVEPLLEDPSKTTKPMSNVEFDYRNNVGEWADLKNRAIPPLTPKLKEMQGKLGKVSDKELKKLLQSDSAVDLIKNKPDAISWKEAYKYYNHLDSLDKAGYTFQKGGVKSYSSENADTDIAFQDWYKANTLEGQNNKPYNDQQAYDYYSYYKNGETTGSVEKHFPDTYKRPSHPTFSNESIYSTPENPGGSWKGEKFKPKGKFKYQIGGTIPAGGGALKPIGESDSFEVKGDNPAATDDVQIQDAFVDHNEVVKPSEEGLRIFSDSIAPPGAKKPFSKLAKDLEKQKTTNPGRFTKQDALVEKKLDGLFQLQQAMNGDNQGESPEEGLQPAGEVPGEGFQEGNMFDRGGVRSSYHPITPRSFGSFQPIGFGSAVMAHAGVDLSSNNMNKMLRWNPSKFKGANFQLGGTKPNPFKNTFQMDKALTDPVQRPAFSFGPSDTANMEKAVNNAAAVNQQSWSNPLQFTSFDKPAAAPTAATAANDATAVDPKTGKPKYQDPHAKWRTAVGTAGTLAPIVSNAIGANNLPEVAPVTLNKAVNLKEVDYSDQKAALDQGLRAAQLSAKQNSANPNAQQAGMGNAQAQYMNAANQMYGDVNRQNTAINNQEAMVNAQIMGQNNALTNQHAQAQQARAMNRLGLQSANMADLSNKSLGLLAQGNQKALDQQKYGMFESWLNKQGNGLADRNTDITAINAMMGNKKLGGVIKKMKKGGMLSTRKLVRC